MAERRVRAALGSTCPSRSGVASMAWMRTRHVDFHLRCIPTTRMIQVNLRSTNTRVVRADPPPLPPKARGPAARPWTLTRAGPNAPRQRDATAAKPVGQHTRRRRRRHFVLGPIPGRGNQIFGAPRRC